jgi:hypothetical protein
MTWTNTYTPQTATEFAYWDETLGDKPIILTNPIGISGVNFACEIYRFNDPESRSLAGHLYQLIEHLDGNGIHYLGKLFFGRSAMKLNLIPSDDVSDLVSLVYKPLKWVYYSEIKYKIWNQNNGVFNF